MTVTAEQVKKLRDQTGAGMMECKAALTEANGDFEEANTILRKRGLASAAKKAGRSAREGLIGHRLSGDHSSGTLVEVNCESDFVARTDEFQQLIQDVLAEIEQAGDAATEAWLTDPDGPVRKRLAASIATLGENMAVPRFVRYAGTGYVGQYIHMGGKIGVQVEIGGCTPRRRKPSIARRWRIRANRQMSSTRSSRASWEASTSRSCSPIRNRSAIPK
jgi:elongation factor Ts